MKRICSGCGIEFTKQPSDPGFIHQCKQCGAENDVPRVKGATIALGKCQSTVQIMQPHEFAEFKRRSHTGSVRNH